MILVCLLAATASLPAWGQSEAGTEIVSLHSQKCLDVASVSVAPTADVNQFRCHSGTNQRWVARPAAVAGFVSFVNENSGLCLDMRFGGPRNGTLQQFRCHSGNNQLFALEAQSDAIGGLRIVSRHSGKCLDIPAPGMQDGLNVQEFTCHFGRNQRWIFAPAGPYRFAVTASPIGRATFSLQRGSTYVFELADLPAGLTPFMHLWREATGRVTATVPATPRASLRFTVPASRGGAHTLFVHAPAGIPAGTGTLVVHKNGVELLRWRQFPVGGTVVDVPKSVAAQLFRYQTVVPPGGVADTFLLALDESNRLQAFDDNGGVASASMIDRSPGVSRIVVGGIGGTGLTILYANDVFRDLDGDGLGYGLEREIRTCDLRLAQPDCATVFNSRDTDRDGIEDGVEVLGVKDGALAFPTWGANPRHKDLFVEADWTSEFVDTPLNQASIRRMQFHLAHGSAAHLDNPDGIDGIALHVDAGIEPTDPTDRTLYGAWNGANRVTSWTSRGPPSGSFDQRRLPWFRHLLLVRGGGSVGWGRYWYATGEDPDTIMHEFGHSLGLHHEAVVGGQDRPMVRGLNCSPAYPSIMSYATPHASFFSGEGFPEAGINPSSLCEADGLGGGVSDLAFITQSLGGIAVDSLGRRVDWNRDGSYQGSLAVPAGSRCLARERVRAAVNWGYNGCDAHIQGGFALSPEVPAAGRRDGGDVLGAPAMTRARSRLYVFYVKRDTAGVQRLFYQSSPVGTKATAGCTLGFQVRSNGDVDRCMNFSGPFEIAAFETLGSSESPAQGRAVRPVRVAAFSGAASVQFAIVDDSARIRGFSLAISVLEAPGASKTVLVDAPLAAADGTLVASRSDLSLGIIGLDRTRFPGSGRHLALYYVDQTGGVRWASRESGATGPYVDRGPMRDASGSALVTAPGNSPAVEGWTALGSLDDQELYMVLQRADASFLLYVFDRSLDRWQDITQSAFGQSAVAGAGHNQKLAFWFQHLLDGNGEVIERGKGFFSILYRYGSGTAAQGASPSTPSMWRMENVSRANPPSQRLRAAVQQKFGHDWYAVRGNDYPIGLGGGFTVHSDDAMPAVKAALVKVTDDASQRHDLQFLPLADGIFDMAFRPSPDFKVMEGTLCRSMRGEAFCGTWRQTKWGY